MARCITAFSRIHGIRVKNRSGYEFRLLNEADVNAVIVESESLVMLFCCDTVCVPLQDPKYMLALVMFWFETKRLVRGWAGAGAAVTRHRAHAQWSVLVTVLAALGVVGEGLLKVR